jgi:2-methylcitrate dehydratase PrpD
VAILPAILAVGEKIHASGKEVLAAYVGGFEVAAKLALVCAQPQYDLGWHTTATIGSIGAAAAVAKMLSLDENTIRTTLGIASSLAGGLRKNFGTMTKPLHAGNAGRNGVTAALLARAGFTADSHILDSPLGFGEVLSGGVKPKHDKIEEALNPGFRLIFPGVALKPYPSCAYSHWAIDAALALKKESRAKQEDIAEVECHTSSGLPQLLIHSRPKTGLEGKFSLEFCVAISLIDGEATLKQFVDEKVNEAAAQKLIQKIKYAHPPEMGTGLVNLKGKLVLKLRNGQTYSRQVDIARGDPRNPLTRDELIRKYRDCVQLFLSPQDIGKSLDMLLNLEGVKDIAELMEILTFRVKP